MSVDVPGASSRLGATRGARPPVRARRARARPPLRAEASDLEEHITNKQSHTNNSNLF